MGIKKCEICGEYGFIKNNNFSHACPPTYYFKHSNWGNDFIKIYAFSFSDAAMRFAELYFEEDISSNNQEFVVISNGEIKKKYLVTASIDIIYNYEEVEDEEDY